MNDLLTRKTKLVLRTPLEERGRPIIAEIKPWGLELREQGRRHRVSITWAKIYWTAQIDAAEKLRAERRIKRELAPNTGHSPLSRKCVLHRNV